MLFVGNANHFYGKGDMPNIFFQCTEADIVSGELTRPIKQAIAHSHSLTVNAQFLGQQIGQVLAVSLVALVAVQLLPKGRLLLHDIGLLPDGGHYVGPVFLELHMRT